ncbi:MAG: type II toxin-antitoxin system prevent-host-death family antitoxin [Clostridia bacterium]|jgi:prevent-host-death family protein|nr:type II toxin-antitoxin system Phd/YefM family antitoxin [Clostridia bacterium]MDH7573132.1 type II toxin-antitoxin system prevent-host-death family antitoxin [Clostridia bacterium]
MTISVSQAKARFLELVRRAENNEGAIVEKKGVPVAAVVPYREYARMRRIQSYLALRRLRRIAAGTGLTAEEIYRESRRELETRGTHEH